ncbi:MAG TPA: asparagine synthase C-terminal domain-containing protein [Nitrososphaeraceae archaeon]|nr:asparagine synthase C-terminal domain-containing protein [Nitrososphaeraceae archaeon]
MELLNKIIESIDNSVGMEDYIGIAFSGGIDSSLLAKISKNIYREKVILLTIGFPFAHDLEFSKKIAKQLDLIHHTFEVDNNEFNRIVGKIIDTIECNNISHIENCIAFHFISNLASQQECKLILTANGFDELFCGYDKYRQILPLGKEALENFMEVKIKNELILVNEINNFSKEFDVKIRQPFLTPNFIDFAKKIPLNKKIHNPNDRLRKHILRELAISLQVPIESAMKRKKALQYGTLIHKNLKSIINKDETIKLKLMTKNNH